ncbi:polyphosphate kinase 1 [Nafulsella turpanensis]|uniref:polyphosphate kinase 1 n=1 Tax=Nafulsella turpanensis TaxID=1265690 RepID=UPI000590122D|nr:polyphosphate kinase 1 [Nafulsella turpanensis]
MVRIDRVSSMINNSRYISRDISWLKFNERVLDQAHSGNRTIFERLKFLSITDSNLDEFLMIRVGSLYNYIDYNRERVDYSGLREVPFKRRLFAELQRFHTEQHELYKQELKPYFEENDFQICKLDGLSSEEHAQVEQYFKKTIYPMITPMVFDSYHTFPILMNRLLIFGVTTKNPGDKKKHRKLSFIQIPQNLPRFYEVEREEVIIFVPIEEIIRKYIAKFFRNVEILSVNLFRITRNGDFTLEESDEIDTNFLEEIKRKLKTRKTGRVVRIEIEEGYDKWMLNLLKKRWELEEENIFEISEDSLIDFSSLMQIVFHNEFRDRLPVQPSFVPPLSYPDHDLSESIFDVLKNKDILLHHPYNSIEPLLGLLEQAAEDPLVLAIKITIYRLADDSRVTAALLKAAENGKNVSVLFEVKARFDEENNIREAQKLQKAGCFVIYGISSFKTHTKLMLIVRKEGAKVTRYVHMSSGNYNENTARLYTDLSLLTTNEIYAHDVSEFFNVITGHSNPEAYKNLITAPGSMREQLIDLIRQEAENARQGLPSGMVIKVNSLEDRQTIDELYEASQAGVPIKLVVRGICCLRPEREGLSENIMVKSIVGDFLEHARLYYFHQAGKPKVYGGSADMMVRSFDRRLESLFLVLDKNIRKEAMNILLYNLRDNVNSYVLKEDGHYEKVQPDEGEEPFNLHREFYKVRQHDIHEVKLFEEELQQAQALD